MKTMLRRTQKPADETTDDADGTEQLDELRRRVGWQVDAAYSGEAGDNETVEPIRATPLPTLPALERLVAAAGPEHAQRLEEWRWYVEYLREFAQADGSLDPTFGLLVETAFAPLLGSAGV